MHEFDARQDDASTPEILESHHWFDDAFDSAVILLHDVIQALVLADLDRRRALGVERFVNRYGQPLSAAGVRFKLKQYVQSASQHVPSLATKRITPHTWRHSVGVQRVAAGVDVTVIRCYLGHARLDTTNHYARANWAPEPNAVARLQPVRAGSS